MKLTNETHISGFVATEPQQSGKGPHRFRLSHGGGKKKDGTEWPRQFYSVSVWDAKAVPEKGQRIEVWGKLRQNEYTDKHGNRRDSVEIVADAIQVEESEPVQVARNVHGVEVTDADIPF